MVAHSLAQVHSYEVRLWGKQRGYLMYLLCLGDGLEGIALRIGRKVVEQAEERLHVILAELLAQEAEKTRLLKHLALLCEPVEVSVDCWRTQLHTDQQTP